MNKPVRILFLFVIILALHGCEDYPKEQYMYIKPIATVYDTSIGQPARLGSVEIKNMLVDVSTPYVRHVVSNLHFSLGNRAYAMTKKYRNNYVMAEKTNSMKIITLRNYNAMYPAGSDITPICSFYASVSNRDSNKHNPLPSGKPMTVAQVIANMNFNNTAYSYYDYASLQKGFVFMLMENPAAMSEQQFAIVFETNTPSRFGDTTDVFTLKP